MPHYPDAVWRPVARYEPGGSSHVAMAKANRLIFHTAVSDGPSLFDLFDTPGNPIAHFYLREDGAVEQYCDTDTRASAVLEGNYDCITVESWDGGPSAFHGTDGPDWTPRQVEAAAQLAAWCSAVHGIPLNALDSSAPGHGVGWHRLGIDGNFPPGILHGRRPGGEVWSTSAGKVCPGDHKIHGVVDDVIVRARQITTGGDMADWQQTPITDDGKTAKQVLARLDRFMDNEADFRAVVLQAFEDLDAAVAGGAKADSVRAQIKTSRQKIIEKLGGVPL
jgi:hypothetical protein